jgi:metallopeptidase family M12-like protein
VLTLSLIKTDMEIHRTSLFLVLALACLLSSCGSSGGGKKGNPNSSLDINIGGSGYSSGDRITGITAGQELNVSFTNVGSDPVSLDPVLLSGADELDVRDFELLFASDYAGVVGGPPLGETLSLPLQPVSSDPVYGEVYLSDLSGIAAWATAAQSNPGPRLVEGFSLPEGGEVSLLLRPLPIPLAPDVQILRDGQLWREGPGEVLAGFSSWSGQVAGDPNSIVFLSFSPLGNRGWIRLQDETYLITSEPDDIYGWERNRTRVTRYGRLQAIDPMSTIEYGCQLVPEPVREPGWGQFEREGDLRSSPNGDGEGDDLLGTAADVGATRLCKLGFETDEDFFDEFGDAGAATTYVTQLVAAVGHRYQQRVQTQVSLVYLSLYDIESDPWVAPDTGGTAEDLLNEFADYWGTSWPGGAANADLGHMLSTGMNQGGIGYFAPGGLLCSRTGGFAVSTGINATASWGSFNFNNSVGFWDFVVVAHEIGHNFGAEHTHEYCPPFDECATTFGTCQTQRDCQKSTLMSYCHTCAGGLNRITPDFEAYLATVMRRAAADSCLASVVLNPGDTLRFTVTYEPLVPGASEVEMSWEHNASNLPSPFRLVLEGE